MRVIATDTKTEEVTRRFPFVEFVDLSYRDYITLLHEVDVVAGLFQRPGMWSMSLVEAMAAGCATIIPRHSGYVEMVPLDYPAFSPGTFAGDLELMSKLITDDCFRQAVAAIGKKHVHEHFTNLRLGRSLLALLSKAPSVPNG